MPTGTMRPGCWRAIQAAEGMDRGATASSCPGCSPNCFVPGEVDEVNLVYTEFVSMLAQEPVCTHGCCRCPLRRKKQDWRMGPGPAQRSLSPPASDVLAKIIPEFVGGMIFGAMCESYASEQGARRMAMEAASENAEEMIVLAEPAVSTGPVRAPSPRRSPRSSGGFEALR